MHRPSRRITLAAGAVAALVLGVTSAVFGASTASADATLTQVSSFGSNPGALAMYDYVPSSLPANAPLVVALHGCTQSASDYYSHSGWPQYADQWNFALLFPQQSSANNSEECFDWYTPSDDSRGDGEAASIMSMLDYMKSHYSIDPSRIYVTGLSAGAGMTADLLADYPDVFAGGSIDSGLPSQCATSLSGASSCQYGSQNLSPGQWAQKVYDSDPGYAGPWPRVAIWQGTSDYTVYPVNATELRDQWTQVWGIGQNASGTATLPGGTTETDYDASDGTVAVALFQISGMGHGLAVNPGSDTGQCGSTGAYFLDYICSSYYTGLFWGLDAGGGGTGGTPPPSTSPPSTPPPSTPSQPTCYTANNYAQTVAGRAHQSGGYTYADGSNQNMGLWNVYVTHTLMQTGPDYYVIADGQC